MTCKFKYGDKVRIARHFGKIVSIKGSDPNYTCKVRFDNGDLIPNEMEYKESEIEFINSGENSCPICFTPWTETKFGNNTWKDCNKCGKKAEDILAMKKDESKIKRDFNKSNVYPPGSYTDDQMEGLLEEIDEMDFDDFGFYQP